MKTILVVEDDRQYRKILEQELTAQKYTVHTAENGKVALEYVRKQTPDLILLDLLMPEMDGITFYYQLQKVLKKDIPIIVLTNVSDAVGYNKSIKEVMIKSNVSLEEVVAAVKKHL